MINLCIYKKEILASVMFCHQKNKIILPKNNPPKFDRKKIVSILRQNKKLALLCHSHFYGQKTVCTQSPFSPEG
ncbi:MAG: hypothetical protein ACD_80C00166G0012 [uncultured bacterium (gcode 4)]|uniref:Uncharacterized protein n=1 Tax=uncultured bacterium (gcode 4) TaxID=1234023 RepID=K1XHN0_9BACT|nr:MAG: hypothetical protein ACD_80C00166G0012 [uncultured bacterium (gcode 4)]